MKYMPEMMEMKDIPKSTCRKSSLSTTEPAFYLFPIEATVLFAILWFYLQNKNNLGARSFVIKTLPFVKH